MTALLFTALAWLGLSLAFTAAAPVMADPLPTGTPTPGIQPGKITPTPSRYVTMTSTSTPETPAPTETIGPVTGTPTWTLEPEISVTVELTTTAELTATVEITTSVPMTIYLPLMRKPGILYLPAVRRIPELAFEDRFVCSTGSAYIPDNDPNGGSTTIYFGDELYVSSLDVYLDTDHTWVGDLTAVLTHEETGTQVVLFDRPGSTSGEVGCSRNNIWAIFDDQASLSAESKCGGPAPSYGVSVPAIGGTFLPVDPLGTFSGEILRGTWTMTLIDQHASDSGSLLQWCMEMTLSTLPYIPSGPPEVPGLPSSAYVDGMWGEDQHLPLDCESRSAVDWARHWGVNIGELEFFYGLPQTLDPDTGFVGSVYGQWGQIPPNPYGVHAEPIAGRLRNFGLPAEAVRYFSWDELRAEIAGGRPVEVWVIGAVASGWPEYYFAPDGNLTVVAPYEHSVILIGYDESHVWVLNGDTIYKYTIDQFLDSWGVLRNMAVIGR